MNKFTIIIGTILLSAIIASAAAFETYRDKYEKSLDTIVVEHGIKMDNLGQQYTRALDSLLGEVKKSGNLDETTSVLDEIERFRIRESHASPNSATGKPQKHAGVLHQKGICP